MLVGIIINIYAFVKGVNVHKYLFFAYMVTLAEYRARGRVSRR